MRSICILLLLSLIMLPAIAEPTITIAFENPTITPTELKDKILNDAQLTFQYEIYNGLNQTFTDLNTNISCDLITSVAILGNHTYCHSNIMISPGLNTIIYQDNLSFSEIASEIAITIYSDLPQVSTIGNLLPTTLNLSKKGNTYHTEYSPPIPNNWATNGSIQIRIRSVEILQNVQITPSGKLRIDMNYKIFMPEPMEQPYVAGTFKISTSEENVRFMQEPDSYTSLSLPCNKKGTVTVQKTFHTTFENLNWTSTQNILLIIEFDVQGASHPVNVLQYSMTYSRGEKIKEYPPKIPDGLKTLEPLTWSSTECTTKENYSSNPKIIVSNAVIIAILTTPLAIITIEQISKKRQKRIPFYEDYPDPDEFQKYN